MLNCSVLDCILHPHHVHRHQLQILHQLSMLHHRDNEPEQDHAAMPSPVATSEGSTRASGSQGDVDDVIEVIFNETDDELSELSHLDAPNESVYMICGVLIAMLLVALIIVLLAITISKLRKRQEASAAASRDVVAMQTVQTSSSLTQQGATVLWTYPVFGSDCQESIGVPLSAVQLDPTAIITTGAPKNGFCRGIPVTVRKKFNKMLKRKPTPEIYTIPAELRHQLKQIYVY